MCCLSRLCSHVAAILSTTHNNTNKKLISRLFLSHGRIHEFDRSSKISVKGSRVLIHPRRVDNNKSLERRPMQLSNPKAKNQKLKPACFSPPYGPDLHGHETLPIYKILQKAKTTAAMQLGIVIILVFASVRSVSI